jgi:hypothetical protein
MTLCQRYVVRKRRSTGQFYVLDVLVGGIVSCFFSSEVEAQEHRRGVIKTMKDA